MKRKIISAKADNMLSLLNGYRVLQPYSLQPSLQIIIPFEEYIYFMSGQCNSGVILSDTLFGLANYEEALNRYRNTNNASLIKVYYTMDCLRIGVLELKRAIARKRSATVMVLQYEEAEEVNLNDIFAKLTIEWERDESIHYAFAKGMEVMHNIGDATPIIINDLNGHNKNYFYYLAYMYAMYYSTGSNRRFNPINIK